MAVGIVGVNENAMVLADDLGGRIADDGEKIGIRRNYRTIEVELDDTLGAVDGGYFCIKLICRAIRLAKREHQLISPSSFHRERQNLLTTSTFAVRGSSPGSRGRAVCSRWVSPTR